MEKSIAVIRLRGTTGINKHIAETLKRLGLHSINNCIIVPDNPEIMGMIKKAKDYITWGHIEDATLKMLIDKRDKTQTGTRKFFRLNPAKGGLGRRGIKAPFIKSGALGDRKEKINDLIQKML